jgi:hypothetical protein
LISNTECKTTEPKEDENRETEQIGVDLRMSPQFELIIELNQQVTCTMSKGKKKRTQDFDWKL